MTDNPSKTDGIITLEKRQVKRAAEVLTRAFFDDPLYLYWFPNSQERSRRAPASFLTPLLYALRYGLVHTPSSSVEGATVWYHPDFVEMSMWRLLLSGGLHLSFGIGSDALRRMSHLGRYITEIHHLDAPFRHWYLQIIGVDPEHQGKGYGGKLLKAGLDRADKDKLPCYLTTNKEKNIGFYEHHGFKVVREFIVPETDFKNWSLLRK